MLPDKDGDKDKGRKRDHYKSNLLSFSVIIEDLKKASLPFTRDHMSVFKRTPFWGIFNAYHEGLVSDTYYKKSDEAILRIIKCYDPKSGLFRFGGAGVRLSPFDIHEIFGLPAVGKKIDLAIRHTPTYNDTFILRNFNSDITLTKSLLEAQLRMTLKGKRDTDLEDAVRIACLLLCATIFFPKSSNNVSWNLAHMFENISKLNEFNWGQAVIDFLVTSINNHQHRPTTVVGCTTSLLFWFANLTACVPILETRGGLHPGFLRWDLKQISEFLLSTDINVVEVPPGKKCPTPRKKTALTDYFVQDRQRDMQPQRRSTMKDRKCVRDSENPETHAFSEKREVKQAGATQRRVHFEDEQQPPVFHEISSDTISNSSAEASDSGHDGPNCAPQSKGDACATSGVSACLGVNDVVMIESPCSSESESMEKDKSDSDNSIDNQSLSRRVEQLRLSNPRSLSGCNVVNLSSSTPTVSNPSRQPVGTPEGCKINTDFEKIQVTPEVVRRLRFDNETLNSKFLQAQSKAKQKEDDAITYRGRYESAEQGRKSASIDCERARQEVKELNEKCAYLMGELSAMTKLKDSIQNECTRLRTEVQCQREYRTSLENEIARLNLLSAEVPSFNIFEEEPSSSAKNGDLTKTLEETVKRYEECVLRASALENVKRYLEKRVTVLSERMEQIILEKDGKINKLYIKLQRLENEVINKRKEVQGIGSALSKSTALVDQLKKDRDLERRKTAAFEAQCLALKNNTTELEIKLNMMKDRLRKYETAACPPTAEPSSLVRGVKTRNKRKQVMRPEYAYEPVKRKSRTGRAETTHQVQRKDVPRKHEPTTPVPNPSAGVETDWNANSVVKLLPDDCAEQLKDILASSDMSLVVWSGISISVRLEDIQTVLRSTLTAPSIVDACLYFKNADFCKTTKYSITLSTHATASMLRNDLCAIQDTVHETLLNGIYNCTQILAPIHHLDVDTFSLVYIDLLLQRSYHLDPTRPKSIVEDEYTCYHDAVVVHAEITKFLLHLQAIAPHIISTKSITWLDTSCGGLSQKVTSLDAFDVKGVQWLQTQQLKFPLEMHTTCPQSLRGSYDSAMCVVQYIRDLKQGIPIPTTYSMDLLTKLRADIVRTLLTKPYGSM